MNYKVRSIVIVGGGTAGWSTAAMLAERYKNQGLKIILVESSSIPTVGVGEATVPGILAVHKNLKISEREFLKVTNATLKLGIEFQDWNCRGGRFFHPFSQFGMPIQNVDFHQYWVKLKHAGSSVKLEEYSLCAALAKKGKFALPDNNSGNPLSWYGYAYHFDAALYAKFLKEYAQKRGVKCVDAKVVSTSQHHDTGYIRSVNLDTGSKVEADLFFDCTGFKSVLLSGVLGVEYIDWSHWLPCDRAIVAQSESGRVLNPLTVSTAMNAGWRWRIPLQNRTGNGYVYASSYLDDQKALDEFLPSIQEPLITQPRVIRFKAGMRKVFWEKNCVAIGLSSGFIEPLESTSISLMHTGVDKVITAMPELMVTQEAQVTANNENSMEYERIRDFIIFHYYASKREDTDFWKGTSLLDLPSQLKNKLDAFSKDGTLIQYQMESFREPSWLAMYNGFDVVPSEYEKAIQDIPTTDIENVFERVRHAIGRGVDHAPKHLDFLKTI